MIERSPPPSQVAHQLLVHLVPEGHPPDRVLDASETAYRQLRERMVILLGQTGFDALWSRALHQVQPGVHALPALVSGHGQGDVRECVLAVFTNCFTLLYTFIGGDLSFRLIRQTWPSIPFRDPEEQAGGANQ